MHDIFTKEKQQKDEELNSVEQGLKFELNTKEVCDAEWYDSDGL
jgi:hypothetical protein